MGSRPRRINYEHAYHHIVSRGTDQWIIFLDDEDRHRFLQLLARVCRRYGVEVLAYCLMGNHFHLVIYVPNANLSDALRDLKSAYGTSYNKRHGRTGPVYGARFWSKVIGDDEHLLDEIRYNHRNPLGIDPHISLAHYEWSSHGIYLGLRPCPPWMHPELAQDMFGPNYQHTVETPRHSDKIQNRPGQIVHAPGAWTIRSEPSLSEILLAVAHCADAEVTDVAPSLHNGLIGIAILVASDLGGFSAEEIAEPFGFRTRGAVQKQLQRARQRVSADATSAALLSAVEHLLQHRRAA